MSWSKVNVLKKAKIFEINTGTPFNLANYTGGCSWGETHISLGISSVEMGYDTMGLKTQLNPMGGNWYTGEIYKIPLISANNYNEYTYSTANENNKGQIIAGDTRNYGAHVGGANLGVKTTGCNPETEVAVYMNVVTYRGSLNDYIGTLRGNVTAGGINIKMPPTIINSTFSCVSFEVRNSTKGYVTFYISNYTIGAPVPISGTLNVMALEV